MISHVNWNFHFGTPVAISINRTTILLKSFAMFPTLGVGWKTILPLARSPNARICVLGSDFSDTLPSLTFFLHKILWCRNLSYPPGTGNPPLGAGKRQAASRGAKGSLAHECASDKGISLGNSLARTCAAASGGDARHTCSGAAFGCLSRIQAGFHNIRRVHIG